MFKNDCHNLFPAPDGQKKCWDTDTGDGMLISDCPEKCFGYAAKRPSWRKKAWTRKKDIERGAR